MNRYTNLSYSTLNDLPLPQIPFEQLGKVLESYQQQQDTFEAVREKGYNVLKNDSDQKLAKQVEGFQDEIVSNLANQYMKGGTQEYMSALRGGIKSLIKLRQPGGAIAALEGRHKQLATVQEELKKKYEKDAAIDNYEVAKSMIKIGDVNYNAETGTYNSITTPSLQNFQDNYKQIEDTIKAMHPEIKKIVRFSNGYVYDEKGTKYHVKDAMESLMASPEFRAQTEISARYRAMTMSDDQKKETIQQANERNQEILDNVSQSLQNTANMLTSNDPKKITAAQQQLQEKGYYSGKITGKLDKATQDAMDNYTAYITQEAEKYKEPVTESNLVGVIAGQMQVNYMKYAGALAPNSFEQSYKGGDWRFQYAAKSKLIDQYTSVFTKPTEPNMAIGALKNTTANIELNIKQNKEMVDGLNKDIITKTQSLYQDGTFTRQQSPVNIAAMYDFYLKVKEDPQAMQKYMEKFSVTPEQYQKQKGFFQSDSGLLPMLQQKAVLDLEILDAEKVLNKILSDAIKPENLSGRTVNVFDKTARQVSNSFNYNGLDIKINEGKVSYKNNADQFVATNLTQTDFKNYMSKYYKDGSINRDDIVDAFNNAEGEMKYVIGAMLNREVNAALESKSMESTNYYFESLQLEDSNVIQAMTNIFKHNGEETMTDAITGSKLEWVDDNGNVAPGITPSSITTRTGVVNGKPVIIGIANDKDGNTYKKVLELSKVNAPTARAISTEMQRLATDLVATGQSDQAKQLIPFIDPMSASELILLENKTIASDAPIEKYVFNDGDDDITINRQFETMESLKFNNNGQLIEIAAVKSINNGDLRFHLVDKTNGVILNDNIFGYDNPNQAIVDLRYFNLVTGIPEGYAPKKSLKSNEAAINESDRRLISQDVINMILTDEPFNYND